MLQEGSLPKIVYIAGYGRSGSTLLDVFLNHHPLMVGVGELSSLFLEWQAGDPCSCGEGVDRCDFWTRVMARLGAELPNLTPAEAERITRPVEASSLRPAAWSNGGGEYDAYVQLWQAAMTAISQESGKPIVVDSSKNSRPAARRISALKKLGGFDVRVVHLVRDPRATMWSALRGRNKLLEAGQTKSGRADAYKALVGWGMANTSVHLAQVANRGLPVLPMRYEDLVCQPAQELEKLGRFLDVDMAPVIDAVVNQLPFEPGHGLRGNRMRRRGPVQLKLDEEWKQALPKTARLAAPLAWPLAHKYGYNVWRNARP